MGYFTPLFEVLFTFPSQYWFAIGLLGVFSLTGWSPLIHAEFHVFRTTQDTARLRFRVAYGIITLFDKPFQVLLLLLLLSFLQSFNPDLAETTSVWAFPRSLATTCGIIIIFFSYG